MQIRTKITLYFFITAAFLMIISFSAIYFITAKKITNDFQQQILKKAKTRAVYRIRLNEVDNRLLKTLDVHKKDVLDQENISIYTFLNQKIYTNNSEYSFSKILPNFKSFMELIRRNNVYTATFKDLDIAGETFYHNKTEYVILVAAKNTYGIKLLHSIKINLTVIFIIILSALWLFGWIFSKKILIPITVLINQVERIKINNISLRLPKNKNKDELNRLTETFNNMLDRLEKSFQIQKSFLANISHELMNPLSVIKTQIEISQLKIRNTLEYEETLSSIHEDITRLINISEQLILLSKISNTSDKSSFVKIRIDEIIFDTKKKYNLKNPNATVKILLSALPSDEKKLTIFGNELLIQSCFYNLIENGVKYSIDNSITLKMYFENNKIHIAFRNIGDPIDPAEYDKLFIPFYRSNQYMNKKGFGIGLSIVKNIIDIHDANIQINSNSTEYTEFLVTL